MPREYTREEQLRILDYIIKNKGYCQLRGRAFWVGMEKSGELGRTWQSMKEHFRKKIFPNLHAFQLTDKDYDSIRFGYFQMKKMKVEPKEEEVSFIVDDDDED